MKKKTFEDFILLIFISTILILLTNGYILINEKLLLNQLNNNFYLFDSKTIHIAEPFNDFNGIKELIKDTEVTIYKEIQENIIGVYSQNESDTPPIISGKYFTQQDFMYKSNNAVIGKNYQKNLNISSIGDYCDIYQRNYEVIGIMGANYASPLDDFIFINLLYFNETEKNQSGIYVITGKDKEQAINILLDHYPNIEIINRTHTENVLFSSSPLKIFFLSILFITVIGSIFSISYIYWINKKKMFISLFCLLGIPKVKTQRILCQKFFLISLYSFIICIIINTLFNLASVKLYFKSFITFLLLTVIIINFVFFAIQYILVRTYYTKKCLEVLKG